MFITLDIHQLKNLLIDAAEVTLAAQNKANSPRKDVLSHRAACGEFGVDKIDYLLRKGLIHRTKGAAVNSRIEYSRTEILAAIKALNLQQVVISEQMREQLSRSGKKGKNV